MHQASMGHFNWVDVIAVILFIRMGYIGFRTGISSELLKLFGLLVGLFLSYGFYQGAGDFVAKRTFLSTEWASALAMVVFILAGYGAVTRLIGLFQKVVQVNFQPKVSQAGGLVVGIFRAAFVTSSILVVCRQIPSAYMESSIDERSLTGKAISRVAPAVYDAAWPVIARLWAGLHPPAR